MLETDIFLYLSGYVCMKGGPCIVSRDVWGYRFLVIVIQMRSVSGGLIFFFEFVIGRVITWFVKGGCRFVVI